MHPYPVKEGKIGVLSSQPLHSQPARQHLGDNRGDHVVPPVRVLVLVLSPRRENSSGGYRRTRAAARRGGGVDAIEETESSAVIT